MCPVVSCVLIESEVNELLTTYISLPPVGFLIPIFVGGFCSRIGVINSTCLDIIISGLMSQLFGDMTLMDGAIFEGVLFSPHKYPTGPHFLLATHILINGSGI